MKTRIIMDNGKVYIIDKHIEDFISSMKNSMGIIYNTFTEIQDGVYINPSHIVEILVTEEEKKQEVNTGVFIKPDSIEMNKLLKNITLSPEMSAKINHPINIKMPEIKLPDFNIKK